MLAVVNFKNSPRGGIFSRLWACLFPGVLARSTYSETLDAELIYMEPLLPMQSPLGTRRCLDKTAALLRRLGCDCFLSAPGAHSDFLLGKGIKRVGGEDYFLFRLTDCVKKLAALRELPVEELYVCVYDMEQADWQKSLFVELTRLCRKTVLIAPEDQSGTELAERLFDENGTACVITDNVEAAAGSTAVVSLSGTEQLIGSGALPFGTVLLCADRSYVPRAELPYPILTDIGVFLPHDLDVLLPDGITSAAFAGQLYGYYRQKALLRLDISSFCSFGRPIPEKNLAYYEKGIDRY